MKRNPWACYRQVATQTASPGQLVLMLYDGTIGFLERALHGFSLEDPAELNQTVGNNVLRAQAILEELDRALDLSAGGEFAARMRGLYHYLDRRLMESNLRKEADGIREVVTRLSVIRDAWNEMLQQQNPSQVPELAILAASAPA
jgi:flagellar secretion chaperone FliS